jgi:hypothetical protein
MLDLSRWNLTLPAGATVIPTNKLNAGYQSPYFVRQDDGAITFVAPSNGADIKSTKNSTYPRSELRETLANGDDKEANWKASSAEMHSLEAELSVQELPKSGKAIIGQIHGESDHPPLKIQITGDTIYAQLRRKLNGAEDKVALLTGYKLGQFITYRFEVTQDGKAKFFINGKQVVNKDLPADGYQFDMASYKNDTWYFKAGIYSQEVVGGTGTGRATFRALKAYHGPAQVVQPSEPVSTPAAPAPRTLATLTNEVAQLVARFNAGTLTAQDASKSIQDLKVEADNAFPKGAERSAFYDQVTAAKAAVKGSAQPEAPVTPAEPASPATPSEAIKAALSAMEDALDDLPDASAAKLRGLISDVRGLVA